MKQIGMSQSEIEEEIKQIMGGYLRETEMERLKTIVPCAQADILERAIITEIEECYQKHKKYVDKLEFLLDLLTDQQIEQITVATKEKILLIAARIWEGIDLDYFCETKLKGTPIRIETGDSIMATIALRGSLFYLRRWTRILGRSYILTVEYEGALQSAIGNGNARAVKEILENFPCKRKLRSLEKAVLRKNVIGFEEEVETQKPKELKALEALIGDLKLTADEKKKLEESFIGLYGKDPYILSLMS